MDTETDREIQRKFLVHFLVDAYSVRLGERERERERCRLLVIQKGRMGAAESGANGMFLC